MGKIISNMLNNIKLLLLRVQKLRTAVSENVLEKREETLEEVARLKGYLKEIGDVKLMSDQEMYQE